MAEKRAENKELIAKRNRDWYQRNKDHVRKYKKSYRITPEGRWSRFYGHLENKRHKVDISKTDFIQWVKKQNNVCHYCGLSETDANRLNQLLTRTTRTFYFQIDRKDSGGIYEIENIALACKVCNEHKKDFFTEIDFRKIAKKHLGLNLLEKLIKKTRK
jgi:hypothetical protein